MPLLQKYKAFVKRHPSIVLNAERLLHWVAWNPERFHGSEYAYEAFNAAVGLLGIYNESILADHPEYSDTIAKWALWLAAVEQVQTLVELRAIQLEQRGKMSKYGPLILLEAVKTLLRLRLWQSSKCTLALENMSREDQQQHECEQELKDLLQALTRLRQHYNEEPTTALTAEHLQHNEEVARASMVCSSALTSHRPSAACAAGLNAVGNCSDGTDSFSKAGSMVSAVTDSGSNGSSGSSNATATRHSTGSSGNSNLPPAAVRWHREADAGGNSGDSSNACPTCGASQCNMQAVLAAGKTGAASGALITASQQQQQQQLVVQQQQQCHSCGFPLTQQQQQHHCNELPTQGGNNPIPLPSSCSQQQRSSSKSSSKLQKGWWQHISSLHPNTHGSLTSSQVAVGTSSVNDRCTASRNLPNFQWHQQWQQQLQQLPWCLSQRDNSIGHSVMWVGELIHVLRPLVYVSVLKRYGLSSWRPWVLSLALDLASGYGLHTGRAILTQSHASRWPSGSTLFSLALLRSLSSSRWSPGEQSELLARRLQLLRYLLRSPCYDAITRRLLQRVVASSHWVPLLSGLTRFAYDMIEGMQSYYTYVES